MYSTDLAYIHDAGFGSFAERAGPQLAAVLRRHGIAGGEIVEIGCGSGAVAGWLARSGFRVRGYDISPAMIRLARVKAPDVAFRVGSLTTISIPPCDAILSVGEVVTYVPGGLPVLRRFFRRAYDALRPGGVLIFDFIESARGRTYATKTLGGPSWEIAVGATFDPSTRILTRRMAIQRRIGARVRRSREIHHVHVYERSAIVAALEEYGFVAAVRRSLGRCRLMRGDAAVIARKKRRV